MSWRTQGQYKGMGHEATAWLRDFDRKWEQKSEGRSRTDAMEHIVQSDGVEKKGALPHDPAECPPIELLLGVAGAQIRKVSGPRPTAYGWEIRLRLVCGRRTWARFEDESAAVQAYLAVCEFTQWFQHGAELSLENRQEGVSQPCESGPRLANRPAQDAPRERGKSHLAAVCAPQNPPSHPHEPPSPQTRSRPA
jgi:hypothetical protein